MEIDELCKAFEEATKQQEQRLEQAHKDTDRVRDQLDRGENPTGYRVEWIRNTAIEMLKALTKQCEYFDMHHPNDRASSTDCLNATLTLVNMLLHAGGMRLVEHGDGVLKIERQ